LAVEVPEIGGGRTEDQSSPHLGVGLSCREAEYLEWKQLRADFSFHTAPSSC